MSPLLFTCPATHQQASTGIETDARSLRSFWKATLKVECPHCGGVHDVPVRETYVNNALQDFSRAARLGKLAHGFRYPRWRLAPELLFECRHGPPLFRDLQALLSNEVIAGRLGEFFAFAPLVAVLVGLALRHRTSPKT